MKKLLIFAIQLVSCVFLFGDGTESLLATGNYQAVKDYFTASPNELNKLKTGNTIPLILSIQKGNIEGCRALIDLGCNLNVKLASSKQIQTKSSTDPSAKTTVTFSATPFEVAMDQNNWQICELLMNSGESTENDYEAYAGGPKESLLQKAIENWSDAYKANRDLLDSNRSAKNVVAAMNEAQKNQNYGPSAAGSIVGFGAGVISLFSDMALLSLNQKKILATAKIVYILNERLAKDHAIPLYEQYWGVENKIYYLDNIGQIPCRNMALDLAVILGRDDLLLRAIALNSQPTKMTLVYLIEFDRDTSLRLMNSYGYLPLEFVKRIPVVVDDEVFQSPALYAVFRNSKKMLDVLTK